MRKNCFKILAVMLAVSIIAGCSTKDKESKTDTSSTPQTSADTTVSSEPEAPVSKLKSTDKNVQAQAAYDTIIGSMDTWCNDNTFDVALIDLDFDGIPELTVLNRAKKDVSLYDLSVYRIFDESIQPITTIDNCVLPVVSQYKDSSGNQSWYICRQFDEMEKSVLKHCVKKYSLFKFGTDNKVSEDILFRSTHDYFDNDKIEEHYFINEKEVFASKEAIKEYNDYAKAHPDDFPGMDPTFSMWWGKKTEFEQPLNTSTYTLNPSIYSKQKSGTDENMRKTVEQVKADITTLVDAYYFGKYDYTMQTYYYGDGIAKPVVYLYPTKPTDVNVKVNIKGALTCTYPNYENGWDVTAYPDGRVINKADGREYSYLYWEGNSDAKWDLSSGFVVKGSDTAAFLQEKLAYLGLTPKEYNEFIVFWLPIMQNNKYNLITFQTKAYEECSSLNVSPKPDSMLRVFMAFKPMSEPVEIPEQKLSQFERKGFSVIEWGGTEIK